MNFQSVVKQGSDLYFLYSFLKRLTTDFKDSKAFELGIIDEKGKVLKKRKTLKTAEERDAYTLMDTLIFNLKKIMAKVPFGSTKLASYAASLFLLKEQSQYKKLALNEEYLQEEFDKFYNDKHENEVFLHECDATYKLFEQLEFISEEKKVEEDAPVNATGVAVAGTGDDSSTVVVRKRKKKVTGISVEDKEVAGQGASVQAKKAFAIGVKKKLVPQFKSAISKAKVSSSNREYN